MITPVLPTYNRAPLAFAEGQGSWLTTTDGRRFLDFGAGIAVNVLGHAHPALVEALTAQAGRVWHVSNLYEIPEQRRLAEMLVEATFADTVFFTNSGTEAAEGAIKMVRKHFADTPGRTQILTFEGSFHGRSTGAIAAAGGTKLTEGFGPLMPGFTQLPWADHEAFGAAIDETVAAVMVEPIQGEGGIRVMPDECLRGLRDACDRVGALLVLDEVQCGVGRTGQLFAHQRAGIAPDIMMVAKGIGGGFPLGALLATEHAARGMTAGTHGSTYGGNPLACAVGCRVMEIVNTPGFLAEVRARAGFLSQKLGALAAAHPDLIAEIRGEGLMVGLRLHEGTAPTALVDAARDQGLLLVPAADNVVRLLPPLSITEEELAEGVTRLDRAASAMQEAAA